MSGAAYFCAFTLLSLSLPIAAHSQSSAPANSSQDSPSVALTKIMNTQAAFDHGLNNPSGPRLRFVKFGDLHRQDGHFTQYRVYAVGVPEGEPYVVALWNIGMAQEHDIPIVANAAYVNGKGLLMIRKPNPDEENSDTVSAGAEFDVAVQVADGEPVRFLLKSRDNKIMVPGTLVPFPIESTDKGCKLTALLAEPEGQGILIYADGFPPNSTVTVEGGSDGQLRQTAHRVDAAGHMEFAVLPYLKDTDSGILKETITTKPCTVSIQIPWGKDSYHKH